MIISSKNTLEYILHRNGEKFSSKYDRIIGKNIEGNRNAPGFIKTFGNSNIKAFTGFIDLHNYTKQTFGYKSNEMAVYLNGFLRNVINILSNFGAMIDKMIGDEIMFIIPEIEENKSPIEILRLGQLLGTLYDYANKNENGYKFRVGLSYGLINVFHLEGDNYSEWSSVGESVNIAKRLHSLPVMKNPDPICGAFGLSGNIDDQKLTEQKLKYYLEFIAGYASKYKTSDYPHKSVLNGIGTVIYGTFC